MGSREHKRAALSEKLQLLRSVANSHATSKTSIILDASKHIKELKQKVERLNQELASAQNSADQTSLPAVAVNKLEKGFLITVYSERSCPGLIVCILEAFEELGLDVLQARVSCTGSFHLEAVGENRDRNESINSQRVKQTVLQAIENWSQISEQE